MNDIVYNPTYRTSWALVIGVNDYQTAPRLKHATQDATAFAEILQTKFGFFQEKVIVLLDSAATRENIVSSFLNFTQDSVGPDDRVAVFFAGHGCTRTGKYGEVGFLVPVDGDPKQLNSLIRWDELTRNADLVQAKHILFVMDACYGGLALRRSTPPGSARFVKDMLKRYSRQVLTAGKANETVADSGGPRPNHSIFTGHLLDALNGNAADSNGIVSANAVMAYVYDQVGKDPHSRQSPHFGFLDGDGDFIFAAPSLAASADDEKEGQDILLQVPSSATVAPDLSDRESLVSTVKEYMSEPRHRIRLDDIVGTEIRKASYEIREEEFPMNTASISKDDIVQRLKKYHSALSRLTCVAILLGKWGSQEHQPLIERIVARLADGTEVRSGKIAWLGLRWYPTMLILYSGGIAALSSNNYLSLSTLLTTKLRGSTTGKDTQTAVVSTVEGILELDRIELFKKIPGYENYYAPRSEYLFKSLQPQLEDLLFLGNGYEDDFDRFEIFYALVYLDLQSRLSGHIWAPPGRFAWKERHGYSTYNAVVDDAKQHGDTWGPVSVGLFARSLQRFEGLATSFREQVLDKLSWW